MWPAPMSFRAACVELVKIYALSASAALKQWGMR